VHDAFDMQQLTLVFLFLEAKSKKVIMEADKFKYRINLCDSQIRQLTLELMDVLTDVSTPDNSDVEGFNQTGV
jgi:hypothetical protein